MKHLFSSRCPDNETLRRLCARFMDGATSPAEERTIYRAFRSAPSGSLAPDLESMRPMMEWYAALAPRKHRAPLRIAGIAAGLAVLIATSAVLSHSARADNSLYARYEGSYEIRNGKRISDISSIYPALRQAEHTADSIITMLDSLSENLYNLDTESSLLDQALGCIADSTLSLELRRDILSYNM